MSQYNEGPLKAFTAGGAIAQHLRVKLSAGVLAAAGVADEDIGTLYEAVFEAGVDVSVILANAQGTRKMVAAGAFAAGAVVYAAAGGKIDDVATKRIGVALEAATANNDIVEVLTDYKGDDGLVFKSGEVTLDGSNPTPVTTGLSTIANGGVVLKSATTPGDDPVSVTADYSGVDGVLNVYAWKHNGTDPTLVASTNNTFVASWWARGTL